MMQTQRWHEQGGQLLSLVLSALLALWLLLWPQAISELSLIWRLPIWCLGWWALGAGFCHGVGLTTRRSGGTRQLLGAPVCWCLLAVLFTFLVLRSA